MKAEREKEIYASTDKKSLHILRDRRKIKLKEHADIILPTTGEEEIYYC
jgi:hypothetical protein